MGLPLVILIIVGAAALLAVVSACYLLAYRRNANRALDTRKKGRSMAPPFKVIMASTVIILIAAVFISYLAGYKTAYDRMEGGEDAWGQTFYGEITGIEATNVGGSLEVRGLQVNDINFRGDFTMDVYPETVLEWRHTRIEFSDLREGDTVSITFTGPVLESYPAVLQDVVRVQLLDDVLE